MLKNKLIRKGTGAVIFLFIILGATYVEAQTATNTATTTPLIKPMTGYCRTEAYYNGQGEYAVTWSVMANPGNNVTYDWSGDASSTDSTQSVVTNLFNTSGRKTAIVTVRSDAQEMTLACGAEFTIPSVSTTTLEQVDLLGGKCSPSPSLMTIFWSGYATNPQTATTTYEWVGDGFSTTTQDASQIIEVNYTTEGVKSAQVRMSSGNQTISLLCQAKIASTTSGCFIATAAFGTEMEPEVVVLRKFRDEKLLTNKMGQAFVNTYYKVSPPVADYIRDKEYLKLAVRAGLKPVIWTVEKARAR